MAISAQAGGKMRSKKSAPVRQLARQVARIRQEEEEPIQVGFQAEPFGLSSLPNFKLLPLPPAVAPSVSVPQSTGKREPQYSMSSKVSGRFMPSHSSQAKSATFTLSAPLFTVSPTVAAVSATFVSPTPSFNFSSPLRIQATPPKAVQKNSKGDLKEVVELKTGSVLDVLGRNSKQEAQSRQETRTTDSVALTSQIITTAKPIELSALHKPPAGSWTCTTLKPAVSFGSSGSLPFVTQSAGMFGAASSGSFGAAPAVAPSAFTFGAQSAPPPQQPIFNTPSNFGFGSSGGAAPAPAAPSSVFTFGNAAGSNSSSFNFTSFPGTEAASSSFASGLANAFDNTGKPNQKIRKAVRRRSKH